MSEKAQRDMLTLTEKFKHIGIHLGSWLLSTGMAVGCAASIYFLCQYEHQVLMSNDGMTNTSIALSRAQSMEGDVRYYVPLNIPGIVK